MYDCMNQRPAHAYLIISKFNWKSRSIQMTTRVQRRAWRDTCKRIDDLLEAHRDAPNKELEMRLGTWDKTNRRFVPGIESKLAQQLQTEWSANSNPEFTFAQQQTMTTHLYDHGYRHRVYSTPVCVDEKKTTYAASSSSSPSERHEYIQKKKLGDVTFVVVSNNESAPAMALRISLSQETRIDSSIFSNLKTVSSAITTRSTWKHDNWTYEMTNNSTASACTQFENPKGIQTETLAFFEIEYQGFDKSGKIPDRLAEDTLWRGIHAWSWLQPKSDPIVLDLVKTS